MGVELRVKVMHAGREENAWITTMFISVIAARLHFMVTSVTKASVCVAGYLN